MVKLSRRNLLAALTAAALSLSAAPVVKAAETLETKAAGALKKLYRSNSTAKTLGEKAIAVMVFPEVVKAGLVIGGQSGDGVLLKKGKPVARYKLTSASYGLQAGVQTYGYAMFFMSENGLQHLDRTSGWEVGVGPSVVVVDKGFGKVTSSTTLHDDVYAVIFDQSGVMAGVGLQGSKISRVSGE